MTTAAERLASLSKLSGVTAAVMLLEIGSGATAGQALIDYSGLPAATAAVHLLHDVQQDLVSEPRGSKRRRADELSVEEVEKQWELLELRTRSSYPEIPDNSPAGAAADQNPIKSAPPVQETAPGVVRLALPANYQEILTSSPIDSAGEPLVPDQAAAAIEAKRKRNNAALAALLLEL